MPVCLSKNVIVLERLTSNPEYWAADSSTARNCSDKDDRLKSFVIIRPEWIELEKEIGEGCFGKVFKGRSLVLLSMSQQLGFEKLIEINNKSKH